jgi:hypothetical protein
MEINPLIFFICFKAFFLLILPPQNKPNQNADRDFIAEGRNSSSFLALARLLNTLNQNPKAKLFDTFQISKREAQSVDSLELFTFLVSDASLF